MITPSFNLLIQPREQMLDVTWAGHLSVLREFWTAAGDKMSTAELTEIQERLAEAEAHVQAEQAELRARQINADELAATEAAEIARRRQAVETAYGSRALRFAVEPDVVTGDELDMLVADALASADAALAAPTF